MAKVSRGTPDQFLAVLDNKIAQLQGGVAAASTSAEGVDTVTRDVIETGSDVDLERYIDTPMGRLQKGTPEQFMSALDAKIAELEGQVESGTRLTAKDADYVTYDTIEAADDTDTSRYIHTLIGDVEDALQSVEGVEGATTQINEDSLTISVTFNTDNKGARVVEYEVPFEDLKFDWSAISEDVEQILEHVQKDAYIEDSSLWKYLASKPVEDSDGFMTEYTLYEYLGDPDDVDGDIYICMFGDSELYPPDVHYADFASNDLRSAKEWFNSFGEDDYDE